MSSFSILESDTIFFTNSRILRDEEFHQLRELFPARFHLIEEKIRDYKSASRKQEVLLSRALIFLLSRFSDVIIEFYDGLFKKKEVIVTPEGNSILNRRLKASISHSVDWIAVGISSGKAIGVDVFYKGKGFGKVKRVVKRFLPELIVSIGDNDEDIALSWTIFESFLKIGDYSLESISGFLRYSKEIQLEKRWVKCRMGQIGSEVFRLYTMNIDYLDVIGSMVVRTGASDKIGLKCYMVKKINPCETTLTRVLEMEELS
ncbi:MAG: hypothetical protein N3G21_04910 [Candidatus Hydrogenedentes bacterium]|nr:hypothetical protein [Candidatus Hydrogenedentota bacterium]